MGYSRSPHQCRLRVKTLKANYMRTRLQRSINSSQPCTFKYFAEMDAVLGRRTEEGDGAPCLVSPEGIEEHQLGSINRTGSIPVDLNPNTDINEHRFSPLKASVRQHHSPLEKKGGCPSWRLDSEVKVEDRGELTDDSEVSNTGFPQNQRDGRHGVSGKSSIHREPSGSSRDIMLSPPSPHVAPPPAPSAPPPLLHSTSSSSVLHMSHPPPESPCLEPAIRHLSECFQSLVSETRGLLMQLETQRMEQARWHQELLTQWMQREERRQREDAEREDRREKARMEHEIRVLELLTWLSQERGCRCRSAAPSGSNHTISHSGTVTPDPNSGGTK